jgi:predicted SprT family Zn-dependent metalloprotease
VKSLEVGKRYARSLALLRERLRQTDLQTVYEHINQESFNGELSDATVEWSEPPDYYGDATFYGDGHVAIRIDRDSVEEQLTETTRHEMCHLATHDDVVRLHQDDQGELFQSCMARFE